LSAVIDENAKSMEGPERTPSVSHVTLEELAAGLVEIRNAPRVEGSVELIVRRPDENEREILAEGTLDPELGLAGDDWRRRSESGAPDTQLTLMSARAITLLARERDRWPLAGDQLYVDLDLSEENLPPGTRLALGSAMIEVTAEPHTGCVKFSGRFGNDALRFVSTPEGRALRLRGMYAKVVEAGTVSAGDPIRKL
jgi:MOSC domain-containing protein YiiM